MECCLFLHSRTSVWSPEAKHNFLKAQQHCVKMSSQLVMFVTLNFSHLNPEALVLWIPTQNAAVLCWPFPCIHGAALPLGHSSLLFQQSFWGRRGHAISMWAHKNIVCVYTHACIHICCSLSCVCRVNIFATSKMTAKGKTWTGAKMVAHLCSMKL